MIRHKARSVDQHQTSTKKPGKKVQRLRKTVMTSKGYVAGLLMELISVTVNT